MQLATEAMDEIRSETGIDSCEFIELDLSSPAGVMMAPYMTTKDGIEFQFGVNHVGHFLLTTSLLGIIKESAPARIINVASLAHYFGDYDIAKILDESKYGMFGNYGLSKISNIMFTNSLAKMLVGTGVTANSLHPGPVNTNLTRYGNFTTNFFTGILKRILFLNPMAGSLTTIKLALSSQVENVSGKYFSSEFEARAMKITKDEAKCQDLWDFTELLIEKHSNKCCS